MYCVCNSFITVGIFPQPGVDVPESQQYHPEELNRKALAIIERVRQKLTGLLSAHCTINLVLSICRQSICPSCLYASILLPSIYLAVHPSNYPSIHSYLFIY